MKNKLDPLRLSGIRQFTDIASEIGIEFIVIGAAARDLVLFHQYDIDTRRRTEDIDFAVLINDWQSFELLRSTLLKKANFIAAREYHRVIFRKIFPIDFIPFGGVEDKGGKVMMPPEFAFELDMSGFKEVFDNSIKIKLDEELIINVTSLAGLAILKIFAWKNRSKGSDVFDLGIIIDNYINAGNKERFFNKNLNITLDNDFDFNLSSAWFLGNDIQSMFTNALIKRIIEIITLGDKSGLNKLAIELAAGNTDRDKSYSEKVRLIDNFKCGIEGKAPIFK